MTIQIDNIKPFISYSATEGQTNFSFNWYVFKGEDIKVYKNDIQLEYLVDYTIPNNSLKNTEGGFVLLENECADNDVVVIFRQTEIKRVSGYTESGDFRSSAVNNDMNYIMSILQELNFQIGRCVILSPSDSEVAELSLTLPKVDDRKGKYLGFDNNGNMTALSSSSIDLYYSWVRIEASQILKKEYKKIFCEITQEITLQLPIMAEIDDGREIFIANTDDNSFNVNINCDSGITINGQDSDLLLPGEYRKYIYNHKLLKFFTVE